MYEVLGMRHPLPSSGIYKSHNTSIIVIKNPPKTTKSRYRQFIHGVMKTIRAALLLQDTPHRIALGVACGVFCSPLPILGQMVLGMILARVFGGNVVASLPWTWISNPFTTPLIWYGSYRLGRLITPGDWPIVSFQRINDIVSKFSDLSFTDGFATGYAVIVEIFVPLLIGTIIVGVISAVLSYLIVFRWVVLLQARRTARFAIWRKAPTVVNNESPGADDHRSKDDASDKA
jgi:uncharacterized protein (DUF2062 family)